MTTVTKTDFVDHKGSIDGGASYNVPPGNERCATIHVPSGPSSLANINLVEGLGDCNAFVAPSSVKISTVQRFYLSIERPPFLLKLIRVMFYILPYGIPAFSTREPLVGLREDSC